jgi:hypothetical protein
LQADGEGEGRGPSAAPPLEAYLQALLALEPDPEAQLEYVAGVRDMAAWELAAWDVAVSAVVARVAYLQAVTSTHRPRRWAGAPAGSIRSACLRWRLRADGPACLAPPGSAGRLAWPCLVCRCTG